MSDQPTPMWVEHVYAPIQGLDHLGLATVSQDRVLEALSPGIRALTIHPRYFSFYAFVIDEFRRRQLPRTPASFQRFYRYCELVYSVGVNACTRTTHRQGFSGVVGSSNTQAWARQKRDPLPPDLRYMDTELGGYGLYYRGRMRELGVIIGAGEEVPTSDGKRVRLTVDLCTDTHGEGLAEGFREAVADTKFYKQYLESYEPVPFSVVAEFGQAGCLCALADDDAPDRPPLLEMLMKAGERSDRRIATFRFFLDIARKTNGHSIDEGDFRSLVYFGSTENGVGLTTRPDLVSSYRGWRLYQAREYYAYGLNTLWACLCEYGVGAGGDVAPISLADIHDRFRGMASPQLVARALVLPDPKLGPDDLWSDVVAWYASQAEASTAFENEGARPDTALNERTLVDLIRRSPLNIKLPAAMGLLALISARFSDRRLLTWPEWELARLGAEERLSMNGFLRDVEEWDEAGLLSLGGLLSRLLDRYIIAQHLFVATRKMPENTFRFEREDQGLRFYQFANPVQFTNSRFEALSTHLADLGLCGDLSVGEHPLGQDGLRLLESGELS